MSILDLILKYPQIFPSLENGKINKQYLGVPNGWIRTLDHMLTGIQHHVDTYKQYDHEGRKNTCPQVICTNMGEVFGVLKFSYEGGDAHVAGIINMAQIVCENICSVCSSTDDLGLVVESLVLCCKDCHDNGKVPGEIWKSNQEINNLINDGNSNGPE